MSGLVGNPKDRFSRDEAQLLRYVSIFKVEETTSSRPQRSSKRSARSRILESFRESPLAKGSKLTFDCIFCAIC